jgi:hypothetical protein
LQFRGFYRKCAGGRVGDERMTWNGLIQQIGAELHEMFLGDVVPPPAKEDDFTQLRRQARHAADAFTRQRALRDELSKRLGQDDKRRAALATRVQIYHHVGDHANAWRYALELDRLRRSVEEQRCALRHAERRCHIQRAHLERLMERLAEV